MSLIRSTDIANEYRNNIIYHIVFDLHRTAFSTLPPPVGLEDRILNPSKALSIPGVRHILNMFEHLRTFKLDYQTNTANHPEAHEYSKSTTNNDDPFFHCCYLAVTVFYLIMHAKPGDATNSIKIDFLTRELQASLALVNIELWITQIPALLSWVCLAGAAASDSTEIRIWFYIQQASAVRVLDIKTGPGYLDDVWAHFYWLRMMRLRPLTRAVEEILQL